MVATAAVAGVLFSTVFVKAIVAITPRSQSVMSPATLTVGPGSSSGVATQVTSATVSATTTARANGTERVSRAASGVITIYNNYSAASQRLIANTRFEAPDGQTYRIHASAVIPGQKKQTDGTTPGSVSVPIYADAPGASFNRTDPVRFTIPGFKGDPRYAQFYAQSQGPISGGFVGDEPAIAAADLTAAESTLKTQLDGAAAEAVVAAIPAGFMAIPGTLHISYSDVAKSAAGGGSVSLSESAEARGAIIRISDLAAAIAKKTVDNYNGEAISFDPTKISLALSQGSPSEPSGQLTLAIAGEVMLVWQFDKDAIVRALVGQPKSSFETIIKSFEPAVASATAKLRPFWLSSFPSESGRIDVITVF